MDIRTLRSLQISAPILLRHATAYIELAEQDWAETKARVVRQTEIMAVLIVSGLVATMLSCILVIALTWDGQFRVLAIGLMTGVFVLTAIASAFLLKQRSIRAFATLRRELREDLVFMQCVVARMQGGSSSGLRGNEHPDSLEAT